MSNNQDQGLLGRVALVTGAGRGIGAATALELARAGARVWMVSRSGAELEACASSIRAAVPGSQVVAVALDVTNEAEVASFFARVDREGARPSILVNNAGSFERALVQEWSPDLSRRLFEVHVIAPQLWAREFFRRHEAGKPASIVNLSSLGGLAHTEKFPGTSSYVAAKFAVQGLTEAWAAEGKALGIRVNAVAPGAVKTRMLQEAAPFLKTDTGPEAVAKLIVGLCGDRFGALSGAVLPLYSNAG